MSVSEALDPRGYLSNTHPDGGQGHEMKQLMSDCGYVVDGIDWVVEKLTHWSLREWLIEKLAGDFETVASMQVGWGYISQSLKAIGENYTSLAEQFESQWEGQTIDAAAGRLRSIGKMHEHQSEGAHLIGESLENLVQLSEAAGQIVAMAINIISDIVTEVLSDAAVPVAGWVKGAISAPGDAIKIMKWIHKGLDAIEKIKAFIDKVLPTLKAIGAIMKIMKTATNFAAMGAEGEAGSHMGSVADAAFT